MRARFALLVLAVLVAAGCVGEEPGVPTPSVTTPGVDGPTATPPTDDGGGSGGDGGPPFVARFDGERAYALVEQQVRHPDGTTRYRVPGTPGNVEVAQMIEAELEAQGYAVTWHHFNATYGCETVAMHNVIGERPGTSGRTIVFAAHYDTRPIADKDPEISRRDEPIAGANDGGSGVAVLLELARVMPPTQDTVRLVFFDGEDGGGYKGRQCTDWILGSRAYAASLPREELDSIRAFVLVDMVGDPELLLPREGYSERTGSAILDSVYGVAHGLGHRQFLNRTGPAITDDHVPFVEAGVPAIDLIHTIPGSPLTFPDSHHTHADDMDAVSAESLAAVGETLEAWVTTLR